MSRDNAEHSHITGNLGAELRSALRGRCYAPFIAGMRLKVQANGLYTYPDVMVVRGPVQLEDSERDTLLNPVLIAEVLSKSTEAYDRGDKFDLYRGLVTLREYLLVSQDRAHIVVYSRQPDGESWLFRTISGLENTLRLDSIDCQIPLAEIYYQVDLPSPRRSNDSLE